MKTNKTMNNVKEQILLRDTAAGLPVSTRLRAGLGQKG